MDSRSDAPSRGFWKGLAHILHLPPAKAPYSTNEVAPVAGARPVPVMNPVSSPPIVVARPVPPPAPKPVSQVKSPAKAVPVPVMVWKEDPVVPNKLGEVPIITDYDRIFELVKRRQSMKLDEIARVLALKEEQVAQELQTLEDNGLVEVKYPAFGEPLIVYKRPDE